MSEFNDDLQLTLTEYYKLEAYRFNLFRFLIESKLDSLSDEKRVRILDEIDAMDFLLVILKRLLISNSREGKQIIVSFASKNLDDIEESYEFSSVETASIVTGISETIIQTACKQPDSNLVKGYKFAYKEDFKATVIKDIKS
jgi:hypothetical protein